jgi:hypothetical protein
MQEPHLISGGPFRQWLRNSPQPRQNGAILMLVFCYSYVELSACSQTITRGRPQPLARQFALLCFTVTAPPNLQQNTSSSLFISFLPLNNDHMLQASALVEIRRFSSPSAPASVDIHSSHVFRTSSRTNLRDATSLAMWRQSQFENTSSHQKWIFSAATGIASTKPLTQPPFPPSIFHLLRNLLLLYSRVADCLLADSSI